ncbi:MAG: inhibitor of cysteine peptidase [Methanohalophilus sp.]|nr:inhibitor of cysteine peptidase [Methanohalophilus sp.]
MLSGCMEPSSPIDNVSNGDNDAEEVAFYSEDDSGSTIYAEVGDTFEIRLEENPSTGYQWNLTVSEGLGIIEDEFIQSPKEEELVGSGGFHVWVIRVNEASEQTIDAIYMRPWENVTGEEDTFFMTISVAAENGDMQEGDYVYGTAVVENVQVMILESFPVQVHLSVSGYLPDGCTEIDEDGIKELRDGFNYTVNIPTKRPADAICTQAIVPYNINVPLDVYGIEKGSYTVNVNGFRTTFELQVDNVIE